MKWPKPSGKNTFVRKEIQDHKYRQIIFSLSDIASETDFRVKVAVKVLDTGTFGPGRRAKGFV